LLIVFSGVGIQHKMTERKRLTVAAFTVGWLVIASGTAGAVVAIGHGGSKSGTAVAAAPSATPSSSASASQTPSPSPTTTTSSAAPTTPSPTSTVTGSIGSGLTHKGDLRFFLLPVPSDGSVIGDPDGKKLSKSDVADSYSNSKEVLSILGELGFKDGATREYQTGDAAYHVETTLMHFSSGSNARLWYQGDQPPSGWKKFKISGFSGASGYVISEKDSTFQTLRGLYYRGDVVIEILIIGQDPVDQSVMASAMSAQVARLNTGK
jgi:hypothetical protein